MYILNNKLTPLPPAKILELLYFALRITSAARLKAFF